MLKLAVVEQIEKECGGDASRIFSEVNSYQPPEEYVGNTAKNEIFRLIVKGPGDLHNFGIKLLREDELFVKRRLSGSLERRLKTLEKYKDIWREAMDKEPVEHKQQNVGRRAANLWLLGGGGSKV